MHEIRTVLSCRYGLVKVLIDLIYLFCHFTGYIYLKNIEKIVMGKPELEAWGLDGNASKVRLFLFFLFLTPADLAIIGCAVSEGSMYAVINEIESIRPLLNLHAQPPVKNFSTAKQVKHYLERHSLRSCVLVVDGETVINAHENLPTRKVEFDELFKTAVERVGKFCSSLCTSQFIR